MYARSGVDAAQLLLERGVQGHALARRQQRDVLSEHAHSAALRGQGVGGGLVVDLDLRESRLQRLDLLVAAVEAAAGVGCLLYPSPSPRAGLLSRLPSSA